MERSIQHNALRNLFVLLLVAVAGFAVSRYANSLAGQVSVVFIVLGVLVTAVSWFQMRLEHRERLERLELDELAKGRSGSALFEASDSELFPAQRSREQFERFFVPIFTVFLLLVQAGGASFLWRWISGSTISTEVKHPTTAMALFAGFALVLFLFGRFSATYARLQDYRLLRPSGSYLLLGAYLCAVVALGLILVWSRFPKADFYIAYGLCVLLALTALESMLTLLLEMYRPRVKGKVGRPLYESRVVGLLGQPEGLITTAAQALDYQFGFKVSETDFYRFFAQRIRWLLPAQLGLLLLSTCVVFIEAGEQGLLERFGRPVQGRAILGAGAHIKWPWPIDKMYRFRTEQIQSFEIGASPDERQEEAHLVLWTVAHTKEDNFLVANRSPGSTETTNALGSKRTPPVSLLTGTIPVQFQINDLEAWAYNNEDSFALLHDLASREVVRYLVGVDMNEILAQGRLEAVTALANRIQAAADERKLGAKIVSVGLHDLHPPVKVAPDYEKVVAAIHTKEAKILAARAEDVRTNALAQGQATNLINQASTASARSQVKALARAALFTNQIPAFNAAPSVYAQRAYLQTFARATANARKYVLLTTNAHDVYQFDFQDKIRADFLESIPAPTPKK